MTGIPGHKNSGPLVLFVSSFHKPYNLWRKCIENVTCFFLMFIILPQIFITSHTNGLPV